MIECRFDNRIKTHSQTFPEKFFEESYMESVEVGSKLKPNKINLRRTRTTNIPQWGWTVELIQTMDKDCAYPWLTWAEGKHSGGPIEVRVPLPTVSIDQKFYRFYRFRLTDKDDLQAKIIGLLESGNTFEISLLKDKIFKHCRLDIASSISPNRLLIDVFEGKVYICVGVSIGIRMIATADSISTTDQFLIKKAEQIKTYISNL